MQIKVCRFNAFFIAWLIGVCANGMLYAQQNDRQERVFFAELERTPSACRRPLQNFFNTMRNSIDANSKPASLQLAQQTEREIRQVIASITSVRNEITKLKNSIEDRSSFPTAAIVTGNSDNLRNRQAAFSMDLQRAERQLQLSNRRLVHLESLLLASRPGGPPEGQRSKASSLFYSSQQITIFFKSGSVSVGKNHMKELVSFNDELSANVNTLAVIQSFTDSVGSSQSNFEMARRRADIVAQIISRFGLDQNRICTVVFGENWDNEGLSSDAARKVELKLHVFK